jgi:hypothetical protein
VAQVGRKQAETTRGVEALPVGVEEGADGEAVAVMENSP